jgi:hypothetical protein
MTYLYSSSNFETQALQVGQLVEVVVSQLIRNGKGVSRLLSEGSELMPFEGKRTLWIRGRMYQK